jgi:LmbE family N-acetylglucosaminyl deacetylase
MSKVLLLSPHTDDAEFGCGGTATRFVEEGKEIYYVAFSSAEKSVPDGFAGNVLRDEVRKSTAALWIPQQNLILLDYEVREFPSNRQKILDDLIRIRDEIEPDLVFLPSSFDIHQDHEVIYREGLRALKKSTILGYEISWNNLTFSADCFILLRKDQIQRKIDAISKYVSQLGRSYVNAAFLLSWAKMRGGQIGGEYAEAFEVIRWIWD